jgi:hypothetical protein
MLSLIDPRPLLRSPLKLFATDDRISRQRERNGDCNCNCISLQFEEDARYTRVLENGNILQDARAYSHGAV